ncbi:uncharacterized protein KY384_006446 [Bacidia gigantensis]|uniref:uncharacterized protein n=1 Tax=Bacidia gigantensis TaxID=2732470 RepID=UPI001D04DCCE|nr:uncharacterized protein KY384_006446 [Bacidia gigantensis]KAG8528759.1 hypothetical protein KY384_006446 [Bacidia gigantensis]
MDPFYQRSIFQHGIPLLALATFVISVTFVVVVFKLVVLNNGDERAVKFIIPIPEQCSPTWKGETLKFPSVKGKRCTKALGEDYMDAEEEGVEDPTEVRAHGDHSEQQLVLIDRSRRYVLENQESITTVACLDSGKTKIDASLGEILVTTEKLKWTIQHGEKALSPEKRPLNFLMMYKHNEVRWEPLGVVTACVSWNYPFHNFISPFISTLFTGSALILKASENTAWSTQHFAQIARGALKACGHSPDLIQPIVCWPQNANHLTSHPDIAHITFIGSRPVAHHVASSAAKSLTPLCVELGGKDSAVILDDIKDVSKVASILLRGTFQSAGQNCIGIERIICLPNIYPQLVSVLERRIRNLRVDTSLDDDNIDVGAMIDSTRFSHLESLITEAVNQGARCLVGGQRYRHSKYPSGHYFAPTLVVDVTPSMKLAQEEVFAPICTLMRASSLPDAIEIANSTPYALGASVFGASRSDLETVTSGVHAGMVSINDFGVTYAVSLPFGGMKGSGYGRFGGEEGLRVLCNQKAVCRDRWPAWVSTSIPPSLDYPIRGARKGWETCEGVVELGYAEGWKRLGGFVEDHEERISREQAVPVYVTTLREDIREMENQRMDLAVQ